MAPSSGAMRMTSSRRSRGMREGFAGEMPQASQFTCRQNETAEEGESLRRLAFTRARRTVGWTEDKTVRPRERTETGHSHADELAGALAIRRPRDHSQRAVKW